MASLLFSSMSGPPILGQLQGIRLGWPPGAEVLDGKLVECIGKILEGKVVGCIGKMLNGKVRC